MVSCWNLLAGVTICTAVLLAGTNAQYKSKYVSKTSVEDVSYALTNLARNLSVNLRSPKSKSDIISPLSVGSSLLLLLRSAKSETRQELLRLLQLDQKYQSNNPEIPSSFGYLLHDLLNDVTTGNVLGEGPKWKNESKCVSYEYEYDEEDNPDEFPDEPPQEPNVVRLANAIFVEKGYFNNKKLARIVQKIYRSTIENLDFSNEPEESKIHINQWANESTNGRIEEIITDQLSRNTRMVVANALYFRGYWEDVFTAGATKPRKFFPNGEDDEAVEVDMMSHAGCFPYFLSKELDARILGFPYKNRTSTMYIILPNGSTRAKVDELVSKLDAPTLDHLVLNMTMRTASILFPKMHLTSSFELKSALQKLGVKEMFNPRSSDFSLLKEARTTGNTQDNLTVGEVLHKVDLEVNEEGTEGGAVTATLMDRSLPSINFRVITPFVLAIRHDATKLLLFYGPVYDPSAA